MRSKDVKQPCHLATWHKLDFDFHKYLAPLGLHSACCNKINAQKPNYDGHFTQILAIIYVGSGSPPSSLAQLDKINSIEEFLLFILLAIIGLILFSISYLTFALVHDNWMWKYSWRSNMCKKMIILQNIFQPIIIVFFFFSIVHG